MIAGIKIIGWSAFFSFFCLTQGFPDYYKQDGYNHHSISKPHVEEVKKCTCVPYYQCNNHTAESGAGLIDERLKHSQCSSYLDVCCYAPEIEKKLLPVPIKHEECGLRHENGIGFRITGQDNQAQYGEFPWVVAILSNSIAHGKFEDAYLCGGSLIHPKVVLTAAHCVISKKPEALIVRGGEWDTQSTHEFHKHEDKKVYKIIVHESFYSGGLFNDIALLVLEHPFHKSKSLDIVCLPYQDEIPHDKHCFVAGWGKDSHDDYGHFQHILKRAEIPMIPRDSCERALRKTTLGHSFKLHESFVCAGGLDVGACKGDGGNALVCPVPHGKENQYQQVGIVSWGIGCGSEAPSVYVNVAHFAVWIQHELKKYQVKHEIKHDYHY